MVRRRKEEAEQPEEDKLAKLMKLTKIMKAENIKVAPKGPAKASNKWRSNSPRFAPKTQAPENTVDAGGMQVDPALRDEYEQWRQDKLQEQKDRREMAERRAKAAAEARKARESEAEPPPESNH